MGRHGTGGAEDAHDRGDSAFWGPDNQQSDSFWGKGEQPEPPGWPSLPDQPEVTGQWAPMPKRDTPPQADNFQSAPFEVTGAFAAQPGADGRPPQGDQPPFETTGAFARPAWDDAPDSTQTFGRLPDDNQGADPFRAQQGEPYSTGDFEPHADPHADPHGAFRRPQDDPFGPGEGQGFQNDPFGPGAPQNDPFGQGAAQNDPFGPGGPQNDPFGPGDTRNFQNDPFDSGETRNFRGDPFGQGDPQGDPFNPEGTARFDPPGLPPEPGDVKVAGEPTIAARTPAWAEAETGFLASGWSGDEQDGSRRGRGRRKPPKDPDTLDAPSGGGRGRLALLSVAAVVVVLGGTVAGVKMMSSPGDTNCPGGRCAAVQGSNQPGPQASVPVEEDSEPVEDEEAVPEDEAPTEEETRPEPTPTDTYSPAPRRTSSPTPKPTKTKSKAPADDDRIDEPVVEEIPEDEPTSEPSDDAPLDDIDNGSMPTQGVPQPEDTPSGDTTGQNNRPLSGGGSSVNVKFSVERQALTGYTATMAVTNDTDQTLSSFTLSVPVRGKVLNVEGAEWTQDGNLLIVDVTEPIATGDSADLRISATGRAGTPRTCGMVGGECSVA